MGFSTGLPIPSLLYDQKMSQKNSKGSVRHCVLITPVWKSRPWYPVILSLLVGQPWLLPRQLDLLRLPGTRKTHPVSSKKLQAGCTAHFRESLTKKEFSKKVSSWRKKTASQYESAWKAWNSWCSDWEINPFSITLENILEFLADLFCKCFKFHTLGVYRSAISSNHETVDGFVIAKHPMMAKFMKGVFFLGDLRSLSTLSHGMSDKSWIF